MTIKIGANPIGWSNDDMQEIGGWITLDECLTQAREAGFQGMELGNKFPREPKALGEVLGRHGMELVSGWYSSELLERPVDAEMQALRPHLDLLKACGANVLVFAETSNAIHGDRSRPLSRRPVLPENRWAEFGARVTAVAEATLKEGVRLVYHHHMGTVVQSEADIDALMAHTGDAAHLLLDTGHATWGGADPARLAARYRDRISHFHAKDIRPSVRADSERSDWSFLDSVLAGVYTVPGDGHIEYVSVLKALGPYSGWLVVEAEQDPLKADPKVYSRLGFNNLRRFAAEAGLLPVAA
jgi:inosose dehydratase